MSNAACDLAEALGAKAILVPTFTGRTASAVARLRPRRPVVALTHVAASLQHMAIEWGVTPLEIPEVDRRRGALAALDRDRPRRGHRRAGRPRRPHRGHRREHPRLHQRHQGRRAPDGRGRRARATNVASWQGGPRRRRPRRRRAARARIGRRRLRLLWAVAIVGIAVYLYYRPISSYLETRNDLAGESRRGRVAAPGQGRARASSRQLDQRRLDRAGGPPHRLREAGRAALRREGHPGLAQGARLRARQPPLVFGHGRSRGRRAPARSSSACFRARRRPLPVRAAGGHRAGAVRLARVRRSRRPTTSRALTSSRRSRGSRPPGASSGGAVRSRATSGSPSRSPRATDEQRRVRRELAGDARGSDGGASLDLGIGGSRSPEHLKCLHAHAAFALARPGYELGERILRGGRRPVAGRSLLLREPPRRRLVSALVPADVESARLEWERRLPRPRGGRARSCGRGRAFAASSRP